MYTIRQASIRTGVGVPLLRAWERRYGVPAPERTASGYRLYDDVSLDQVRRMRALVEAGWAPSQAARSVLEGSPVPVEPDVVPAAASAPALAPAPDSIVETLNGFLESARTLDEAGMDRVLAESAAVLGVDETLERVVMPALVAIGEAWARGDLDVASEHAASNAILRRLAGIYDAAGLASSRPDCLVGLPPGARHEIGALAFAIACRRAGMHVLYLGADLPVDSWLAAAGTYPGAAIVLGAVTEVEADSAARVVAALMAVRPQTLIAVGGAGWARAAARSGTGTLLLPERLRDAAALLAARVRTA